MRKMVVFADISSENWEKIHDAAPGWEIVHGGGQTNWLPHLHEAEIICGWNPEITSHCLRSDSQLRWLQAWGAGVDKFPLDELNRRNIMVTSASGVHPSPVSETVYAMMLCFSRKVHVSIRNQRLNIWGQTGSLDEIHGRTIGIMGVGAIGTEIARIAKAFGMNVLGIRRSGKPSEYVDHMYSTNELTMLLQESDYLINILPLTKETQHIIGKEQFKLMKSTAYYINIGRGPTTDMNALIEALQEKGIAGAGLDVFDQEPLPADHPLWGMDNVIMTPHNAGTTVNYEDRVIEIFLTNLRNYIQGQEPSLNRVDMYKQY